MEHVKFRILSLPAIDVAEFCIKYGYELHIENGDMWLERIDTATSLINNVCEYCSHSLDDNFNCLPCVHYMDARPYADNTIMLENMFIASPSIIFRKGTPEWLKKEEESEET